MTTTNCSIKETRAGNARIFILSCVGGTFKAVKTYQQKQKTNHYFYNPSNPQHHSYCPPQNSALLLEDAAVELNQQRKELKEA
eukprot:XP_001704447.1 Hypothetical protein GL50803_31658 [Giardia lamblia ATCC 50803]